MTVSLPKPGRDSESAQWHLVQYGSRPLLAFPPALARDFRAVIRCYPGHTWKKRVLRLLLRGAFACGLGSLAARSSGGSFSGFDFARLDVWLTGLQKSLASTSLRAVVVWPAQADRGRLYVHVLNAGGQAVAFAKIALDAANRRLIENERQALDSMDNLHARKFKAPRILQAAGSEEQDCLAVEAVPAAVKPARLRGGTALKAAIQEYSGPSGWIDPGQLPHLKWWQDYVQLPRLSPAFGAVVDQAVQSPVAVCRVHGDLNRTNIVADREDLWLLDWERSAAQGPVLTDPICLEADALWPASQRRPVAALRQLLQRHWHGHPPEYRASFVMALAFLRGAEFPPVCDLLPHWETPVLQA